MWKPYLNVIAEASEAAIHVRIMKKMNQALNEVHHREAARLKRDGYDQSDVRSCVETS